MNSKIKDIAGKKYGRLTVLSFAGTKNYKSLWNCVCECGNMTIATGANLSCGTTKSCGCIKIEKIKLMATTHGHSKKNNHSRTYNIWEGLSKRCNNKNHHAYKYYGERGIFVCVEWKSFEVFLSDMGECPDGMSLDRINNDDGYYKENCRWADKITQSRNRRNIKKVNAFGLSLSIPEWSEITGLSYYTIYLRLRRGLSGEDALS